MEKLWQKLNKKWHKEIKDKKWKFRWFFPFFLRRHFAEFCYNMLKNLSACFSTQCNKKNRPKSLVSCIKNLHSWFEYFFQLWKKRLWINFSRQKFSGENSSYRLLEFSHSSKFARDSKIRNIVYSFYFLCHSIINGLDKMKS